MAAKTTLNAKNLEALGAERLAALLIEISTGNAAAKRRLRLELAGSDGSAEVARAVRKRLATIARSRTVINWRRVKTVRADLEIQRTTIVDAVAPADPAEAFDLLWQFLALAEPVLDRSKDSNGTLMDCFRTACADAGRLAVRAGLRPDVMADRLFSALRSSSHGQFDTLIGQMAQALGEDGLAHLRRRFKDWAAEPGDKAAAIRRRIASGVEGFVYEDELADRRRDRMVRQALQEIADAEGDVDAYIAQQPAQSLQSPSVAAGIARRLLAAGRPKEALAAVDAATPRNKALIPFEWQQARIDALEADGRADEAQRYRWTCFEQALDGEHLRAYVRRLPDFDDMEAEEKGFAYVQAVPDVHRALGFFLAWPAPGEAAKLIVRRRTELDGDLYELMSQAAEMLRDRYPQAATLALRAMIDFTLQASRSSRYKYATRHLDECAKIATHAGNLEGLSSHEDYIASLRRHHGKRLAFWSVVDG